MSAGKDAKLGQQVLCYTLDKNQYKIVTLTKDFSETEYQSVIEYIEFLISKRKE